MTHAAWTSRDERLPPAAIDLMLAEVRERHGVDFRAYRRATVERRIRNAMIAARVDDPAAYVVRLRADPAEAAHLLERLTVKVSRVWRDAPSIAALQRALRELRRATPHPLRAWSAGCARGEEAYSLAIVLAEEGIPTPAAPDVLGTDVDLAALAAAAFGAYPPEALEELPVALRHRHLERTGDPRLPFRMAGSLRARVAFERRDLAAAPPRGSFDLVACRNTLIYFEAALQREVVAHLVAALRRGGLLWLGEAEWIPPEAAGELEVVDWRARLFRRRSAS
ncbi:MAG: protein-glutamate O-methyltransferase CheR [Anaeromyxobacteraceae bacterium]